MSESSNKPSRYTEAQKRSAEKYLAKKDDIKIRVANGERDVWAEFAKENGWTSVNKMVVQLVDYAKVKGLTESQVSEVLNDAIRDAAKKRQ